MKAGTWAVFSSLQRSRSGDRTSYQVVEVGSDGYPARQLADIGTISDGQTIAQKMAAADDMLRALEACAADLSAELNERYPRETREQYPSVAADYERDMQTVIDASAAIARAKGDVP
jgi:hypothetical protein